MKRQKADILLLHLGMVIYDAQRLLGSAVNNYWKLKAIDSLGATNDSIPEEERNKIIDK